MAIALALLVVACAAKSPEFIATETSDDTPLQAFLLDPFEEPLGYSLLRRNAMESVRSRFGEPTDIRVSTEVDRYAREPRDIRVSTLEFDGLEFTVRDRPGEKGSWLTRIVFSGRNYSLKYGVGIGASREAVIAALKPKSFSSKPARLRVFGNTWEKGYRQDEGRDVQVSVDVTLDLEFDENDNVMRIVWQSGDD